jgi:chromosome segregation ATPase
MRKDEILNSLNKRILSLKFKIATKTKSTKEKIAKQKVESVSKKLETAKSDTNKLEAKLSTLKVDWEGKSRALESELEAVRGKINETFEITQLFKEENLLKAEELKETEKDLKDIKKILKNMTEIYINIQGKMDEKRYEINELNSKYFESVLNTEDFDELEAGFKDVFVQASRTKQEKEKIQKSYKKIKKTYEKIQKFPIIVENILENLKELDGFIESIIDEREIENILKDSKEKIEDLQDTLKDSLKKPFKVLEDPDRKSKTVRVKFKGNEKIMKDLEKDLNKLENHPLAVSLKENVSKLATMEQISKQNLESLAAELVGLKTKMKSSKEGFKNLLSLNQSADFDFNQVKIKNDTVANQLKLAQSFRKNDLSLQEELKNELNVLVKKADKSKSNALLKDANPDARKVKNLVTQVTVLHEELMKKDSQILKRWRELLKTQKESKKLQKSIQGYEIKIKQTSDEIYQKFNEEIEKKSKEIDMLKEILKGNAHEIKAKEVILSGIKKQLENIPNKNEKGEKSK